MIEFKELKVFAQLPAEFTSEASKIIEQALEDYRECRIFVSSMIDFYGADAFKNAAVYVEVGYDVMNLNLPKSFEKKLLATLAVMKAENCNEQVL